MALKASYLTIVLGIVLLVGGVFFVYRATETPIADPAPQPSGEQAEPQGKVMSIESYVTQNISALSPEKEVLGGTFYVTEIEAAEGRGVVKYEDGHIALVADFTYTMSDREGIRITSFVVRK